jgi:hypothetical protein
VKLTKVAVFSLSAVLAQASFADQPSGARPMPERLELFPDCQVLKEYLARGTVPVKHRIRLS